VSPPPEAGAAVGPTDEPFSEGEPAVPGAPVNHGGQSVTPATELPESDATIPADGQPPGGQSPLGVAPPDGELPDFSTWSNGNSDQTQQAPHTPPPLSEAGGTLSEDSEDPFGDDVETKLPPASSPGPPELTQSQEQKPDWPETRQESADAPDEPASENSPESEGADDDELKRFLNGLS
jgi:hypothetical protein